MLFHAQYAKIFITAFPNAGEALELAKAIAHQKSFRGFVGILALVSLALAVVGVMAAILIPLLLPLRV